MINKERRQYMGACKKVLQMKKEALCKRLEEDRLLSALIYSVMLFTVVFFSVSVLKWFTSNSDNVAFRFLIELTAFTVATMGTILGLRAANWWAGYDYFPPVIRGIISSAAKFCFGGALYYIWYNYPLTGWFYWVTLFGAIAVMLGSLYGLVAHVFDFCIEQRRADKRGLKKVVKYFSVLAIVVVLSVIVI